MILAALVSAVVAGAPWGFPGQAQDVLKPMGSTLEAFVRLALEDRLAVNDIPDIKLLGGARRIGIREEAPLAGLKLSAGALPRREGYEFYLVSRSAAQSMADQTRQHLYLITVDRPAVSGSSATIWLGVDLVAPQEPKTFVLCCCRMLAQFERREEKWRFEKRLDIICR